MTDWLSGAETVERLNIRDSKLVEYVQNGLQPFDDKRTEVSPPDVAEWQNTLKICFTDISTIDGEFPEFRNKYGTTDWFYESIDFKNVLIEKFRDTQFPHGHDAVGWFYELPTDSSIREAVATIAYSQGMTEIERLREKLKQYSDLPRWTGYQLPEGDADQALIISTLLNSSFKLGDILELEGAVEPDIQSEPVPDYITRRREAGAIDALIAYELHNQEGSFKLPYLEVARMFDLGTGLNVDQIVALKQRGSRFCKKGEALLQKQKDSTLNV